MQSLEHRAHIVPYIRQSEDHMSARRKKYAMVFSNYLCLHLRKTHERFVPPQVHY
jgi:hypothetical protein